MNKGAERDVKLEVLMRIAKPIVDFIRKNYDLRCTIIIDWDSVKVMQDVSCIQYKVKD